MSALQALKAARDAGVRIRVDGDAFNLEADAAPDAAVLKLLSRHKHEVISLLRNTSDGWPGEEWRAFYDQRAAIVKLDGGLPHRSAEAQAFACCVAEWLHRNPVRSSPGRCLGCGCGDHARDALLPFGAEPTGHAWLHSRCWDAWHAGRNDEAVAALSSIGI